MMDTISALDTQVLSALYAARDSSLVHIFTFVTNLGTAPFIYGGAACIMLALLFYRHYAYATGLLISVISSGLLILLIKGIVARSRPLAIFQAYPEIWHSFPSSHAALSVALYGYLIFLIWNLAPSRGMRITGTVLFSALVAGISFSRIYLGVHYLSDVIAGVLLGTLCVWLGYRWSVFTRSS